MGSLKTTKTPRKAPAKTIATKLTASKKKSLPNASILTYFKKTADESLFVGEQASLENSLENGLDGEDIYGAEDDVPEIRFNEVETPVKKRRLTPPAENASPRIAAVPQMQPPATQKKPKKPTNNPFLDDSSDEGEDVGSVTPPTSGADQSENESKTGVRRSVVKTSDPLPIPLLRQQTSNGGGMEESKDEGGAGDGVFGDFADVDMDQFPDDFAEEDEFAGEEYREMRYYMEEQARLEAEETNNGEGDGVSFVAQATTQDAITECCPICNSSLSGVTADQAMAHVNACLDGKPVSLPRSIEEEPTARSADKVDGSDLGKRFARAAVPRPGQTNPINLGGSGGGQTATNTAFAKLMSGHAEDAAWQTAAAAEHASRGKPAYQRTCPFYKIMPGFLICVDAFRYGAVEGCKAYFLSHFHSDHYIGLTASWTHGPIYCSQVTGSLVKSQLRTAGKYVVELEFEKRVPVPDTNGVTVTMIPANHCPGSSLFLFEKATGGRTQRILHCGDFRACPAHVRHPQLRPETVDAVSGKPKQQKIDVCYLDTTYLNPRYSFPPQEDVIRACADLCVSLNDGLERGDDSEWNALLRRREGGGAPVDEDGVNKFFVSDRSKPTTAAPSPTEDSSGRDSETKGETPCSERPPDAFAALGNRAGNKNRLLVVCGTYSIGKERICKAIAQALHTKIFASAAKIRTVQQLGDPELSALMTSDPRAAQVHMQMLMEIRAETLAEYLAEYRAYGFARIVGFRPSGWNYRPPAGTNTGMGGRSVSASLAPGSLATPQLLHGAGWRTRFGARDLAPQRGSGREALCLGVPYSEHSSFRELALFLLALRVERVVPTVNVGSEQSRRRMKGWIDRWLGERRKGGLVTVLEDAGEERGGDEKGANGNGGNNKGKEGAVALWEGKDGKGGGAYW